MSKQWLETWAQNDVWTYVLAAIVLLVIAAWVANAITKYILVRAMLRMLAISSYGRGDEIARHGTIARLANVVPALVLWIGIAAVPKLPETLVEIVRNVCGAYIILALALAFAAFINTVNDIYQRRPDAVERPIKGYLQVLKIAMYVVAAVLIVATLIDRSPLILLSGLGAMAAVLLLIFQDTLLSLVASVQLSSNDMIRVGDWIEMPQVNADGDVIDIALHTVKVQNWDKTITTIPTKRLISESFKNWRGMQESGGRRIKRALLIDQNSIHLISEEEQKSLRRFILLKDYLEKKTLTLKEWNAALEEGQRNPVNIRRITNIGTFRAYIECYLRNHTGINQQLTLMARQLAPCAEGLPLEVYCFTKTIAWAEYEGIQSDIFDHLLAILPEFGLRVFQQPSGSDIRAVLNSQPPVSTETDEPDQAPQQLETNS